MSSADSVRWFLVAQSSDLEHFVFASHARDMIIRTKGQRSDVCDCLLIIFCLESWEMAEEDFRPLSEETSSFCLATEARSGVQVTQPFPRSPKLIRRTGAVSPKPSEVLTDFFKPARQPTVPETTYRGHARNIEALFTDCNNKELLFNLHNHSNIT